MNLLSREDRSRFVEATRQIGEYLSNGHSPQEAIKMAADEAGFGPEFVKRLAEVYNAGVTLDRIRSGRTLEEKTAEAELVDANTIIARTDPGNRPIKRAKALDFYGTRPRNYLARPVPPLTLPELSKAANIERPPQFKMHEIGAKLERLAAEKDRAGEELREAKLAYCLDFKNALDAVSTADTPPFAELESAMIGACGKIASDALEDVARAIGADSRGHPPTKSQIVSINHKPHYSALKSLISSYNDQKRAEAEVKRIHSEQQKVAEELLGATPEEQRMTVHRYLESLGIKMGAEGEEKDHFPFLKSGQGQPIPKPKLPSDPAFWTKQEWETYRLWKDEEALRMRHEKEQRERERFQAQKRKERLETFTLIKGKKPALNIRSKEKERRPLSEVFVERHPEMQIFKAPTLEEEIERARQLAERREQIGLQSVFTPAHEEEVRSIQTRAVLNEILATDPILKGRDPGEVIEAFNEIVRLMPEIIESKPLLVSMLRQYLERQYGMEPSSLLELVERSKNIARKERELQTE